MIISLPVIPRCAQPQRLAEHMSTCKPTAEEWRAPGAYGFHGPLLVAGHIWGCLEGTRSKMASMAHWLKSNPDQTASAALASSGEQCQEYLLRCKGGTSRVTTTHKMRSKKQCGHSCLLPGRSLRASSWQIAARSSILRKHSRSTCSQC